MNNCIKSMKLYLKAFYNELEGEEKKWFFIHLEQCEKCSLEYEKMTAALDVMNERKLPEPEENYWNEYTLKLSKKIEMQDVKETLLKKIKDRFLEILAFQPRLVFVPAAVLLFITIGAIMGKNLFYTDQDLRKDQIADNIDIAPYLVGETIDSYLERSKIILSTISNFDPVEDDVYSLDIPSQKEVSRKLVRDAELLQSVSEVRDKRELLKLVYDLQLIMLRILELDEMTDEFEIDLLKLNIENSALLFKINIEQIKKLTEKSNLQTGLRAAGKTSNS
ncbi:MAG: hypothetical protein GY863_11760 [bacterium]|nr:hypothetical protein [bacterium]